MNFNEYRKRAVAILSNGFDSGELLPVDYLIDDECRRVLDLPPRPSGSKPYIGWMMEANVSPKADRRISQEGIDLIKRWEGMRTNAYLCPAGVWTIGYGHTKDVKPSDMVSHLEAEKLLKEDLKVYEDGVKRLVKVNVTQGQYDALVSFAFNCGVSALAKSTLLRKLNRGDSRGAAREFDNWVYGGGRILPGLVTRRRQERKLFES